MWKGRYNLIFPDGITQFPSENYEGIVLEKGIPLVSVCSHHHQTIEGKVHIAYIPKPEGNVVGLSKLKLGTPFILFYCFQKKVTSNYTGFICC